VADREGGQGGDVVGRLASIASTFGELAAEHGRDHLQLVVDMDRLVRLFGMRRRLDPRVLLAGPKRYLSSPVSLLTSTNHNHYDHILDWETLLLPR
jgi:hypothetical protein